jgi:hypothetical protein
VTEDEDLCWEPKEMRAEAPEFVPEIALDLLHAEALEAAEAQAGQTVLVPCVLPADGFASLPAGLPMVEGEQPPGHVLVLAAPPEGSMPVMMPPCGLPMQDMPDAVGGVSMVPFIPNNVTPLAPGNWDDDDDDD